MDKKSTIVGICVTLVLVGAWIAGHTYIQTYHPEWFVEQTAPETAKSDLTATQPATGPSTSPTTVASAGTNPTTVPSMVAAPATQAIASGLAVKPANIDKIFPAALGSSALKDPTYAMQVEVSPVGAGIDGVTLNDFRSGEDFRKPLDQRAVYSYQHPLPDRVDVSRPLATSMIYVDERPISVAGVNWARIDDGKDSAKAQYQAIVTDEGQPKLELTRTFTLTPRASDTKGFEVTVDLAIKNLGGSKVKVRSTINGPGLPPRESSRTPDRQIMAGYADPKDNTISFKAHALDTIKAEQPTLDLTTEKDLGSVVWAGTSSIYFDSFVLFNQPQKISKVTAREENFETIKDGEDRPTFLSFDTAGEELAKQGDTTTISMTAFFGPRWRDILNTKHYSDAPRHFDKTLIITSGPCGYCTFDWLIQVLVWMLAAFHTIAGGFANVGDWGIAIILLVALVRTLLHPITKRSQVQMMKMGKMGPALAKLKEKYGDDKEAFTKAQMEVMKEQGMAPILGCLPMFLQMPIWMALWQALQSTFELRQAPFLWGFTWIHDLSRPDFLVKFDSAVPLIFSWSLQGINLLPLLMAVIFHVQARIQNSLQPAATPEQVSQKKMMMWMSTFLFPIFLYNGPSGLNLYILTSTLVGIIESKIIRDHIKQKEAEEKANGPVVVDARPTRGARRAQLDKQEPPKPATGLLGFVQRLQQRAEDMRRENQKPGGGKGK